MVMETPKEAMEKGLMGKVLQGQFTDLPPPKSKIVRIFLSSTFTDMGLERNHLIQFVYPKLKSYCKQKHNLDFQVVDMRWGVRDDSSNDHSTTQLCLQELANCQNLSIGPNFVALIGQRYGTCVLPASIPGQEFESIRSCISTSPDLHLLDVWYRKDENASPPVYILQPKSDIQDVDKAWNIAEGKLDQMLREGATLAEELGTITSQHKEEYFKSVTENELQYGVFQASEASNNCLCFIRELTNINYNHDKAWRFTDMEGGKVNMETQNRLNLLKNTYMPQKLPASNIFHFKTSWSDNNGVNMDNNRDYIEAFAEEFLTQVKMMVDRAASKVAEQEDKLGEEVLHHARSCQQKCKTFVGRENFINRVKEYVTSDSQCPLLVAGDSGCGKTSILAMAAKKTLDWMKESQPSLTPVVILRFLGTTPATSTLLSTLKSLIDQLEEILPEREDIIIPEGLSTEDELEQYLKKFYNLLDSTRNMYLAIYLDSIDQLSETGGAHKMRWLKLQLPANVKIVISTIDSGFNIVENMKKLPPSQLVSITKLEATTSEAIINNWLQWGGRNLTGEQWQLVKKTISKKCTPLYLKLLFDEIKDWKSYTSYETLPSDVQACIFALFDKLKKKHGDLLVSHAMRLIVKTTYGVSEMEMEEMLSIDDQVLTDIFQYHIPPQRVLPSILWKRIKQDLQDYLVIREADGVDVMSWYHRQFKENCKRYFTERNSGTYWHPIRDDHTVRILLDYFTGKWYDKEKPFEYNDKQMKKLGLTNKESKARRYVSEQVTVYREKKDDGNVEYKINFRKMKEFIPLLVGLLGDFDNEYLEIYIQEAAFNIECLFALLHIENVNLFDLKYKIDDFDGHIEKRVLYQLEQCLSKHTLMLRANPLTVGPLLSSMLLKFYNCLPQVTYLIDQIDSKGLDICALVSPCQQLPTGGGHEYLQLTGHVGTVGAMADLDGTHIISASRKVISVEMNHNGGIKTVFNKIPDNLPQNDYFAFIMTESFNKEEGIVLGLKREPILYVLGKEDGKTHRTVMCQNFMKEKKPLKGGVQLANSLYIVIFEECAEVHAYEMRTGELIGYSELSENALGIQKLTKQHTGYHSTFQKVNPSTQRVAVFSQGYIYVYSIQDASLIEGDTSPEEDPSVLRTDKGTNGELGWYPLLKKENVLILVTKQVLWPQQILMKASAYFTSKDYLVMAWENGEVRLRYLVDLCSVKVDDPAKEDVGKFSGTLRLPRGYGHCVYACRGPWNTTAVFVCSQEYCYMVSFKEDEQPVKGEVVEILQRHYEHIFYHNEFGILVGCTNTQIELVEISKNDSDDECAAAAPTDGKNVFATFRPHTDTITEVKPNDPYFMTRSLDGTCKVYAIQLIATSNKHVEKFESANMQINTLVTGRYLSATLGRSFGSVEIIIWNVQTCKVVKSIKLSLSSDAGTCALSPDDLYIIAAFDNGTTYLGTINDQENKAQPFRFKEHSTKQWIFFLEQSFYVITNKGEMMSVNTTSGKHHLLNININESVTSILLQRQQVIAVCNGSTVLKSFDLYSGSCQLEIDLQAPSGSSLRNYGSSISNMVTWQSNILLHIGTTLLCFNQSSAFPVQKEVADTKYTIHGDTFMVFLDRSIQLQQLSDKTKKLVEIPVDHCLISHHKLTPDGKYLIVIEQNRTLCLYRVQDGVRLAYMSLHVAMMNLEVTSDSRYVILTGTDWRLYCYLIVDPEVLEHRAEVKTLPSRNQFRSQDDQLEMVRDPRFKQLLDMTVMLESSSYRSDSLGQMDYYEHGSFIKTGLKPESEAEVVEEVVATKLPLYVALPGGELCVPSAQYNHPAAMPALEERVHKVKAMLDSDKPKSAAQEKTHLPVTVPNTSPTDLVPSMRETQSSRSKACNII